MNRRRLDMENEPRTFPSAESPRDIRSFYGVVLIIENIVFSRIL
jgi:hypothetical protein